MDSSCRVLRNVKVFVDSIKQNIYNWICFVYTLTLDNNSNPELILLMLWENMNSRAATLSFHYILSAVFPLCNFLMIFLWRKYAIYKVILYALGRSCWNEYHLRYIPSQADSKTNFLPWANFDCWTCCVSLTLTQPTYRG